MIDILQYKWVEKDWYEVSALGICEFVFEGHCCKAFLLELIKRAKQDKAEIINLKK